MRSAHWHVKRYEPIRVTVNRAVFDKVKRCCFTQPLRPFQEDPNESYHLAENGHPMSPLKHTVATTKSDFL